MRRERKDQFRQHQPDSLSNWYGTPAIINSRHPFCP
jgi:hypothetical protein